MELFQIFVLFLYYFLEISPHIEKAGGPTSLALPIASHLLGPSSESKHLKNSEYSMHSGMVLLKQQHAYLMWDSEIN